MTALLTAYEDSMQGYLEIQQYLNDMAAKGYAFRSWLVTPGKRILVLVSKESTAAKANVYDDWAAAGV